jgi:hypothetical protein
MANKIRFFISYLCRAAHTALTGFTFLCYLSYLCGYQNDNLRIAAPPRQAAPRLDAKIAPITVNAGRKAPPVASCTAAGRENRPYHCKRRTKGACGPGCNFLGDCIYWRGCENALFYMFFLLFTTFFVGC